MAFETRRAAVDLFDCPEVGVRTSMVQAEDDAIHMAVRRLNALEL